MTVPTDISDLSTTAASNAPAGSEAVFPDLDNYLRAAYAFIAQLQADKLSAGDTLVAAEGTASAPSVTNSTGNTGAYWPTTTSFAIATAGVNAITVDASQNVGIGAAPGGVFTLEVVKPSASHALFRSTVTTGLTSVRLFNDQNSSGRALEIDYSGSAYASALLAGGPTGESAALTTTGAFPLVLGTSNTARLILASSGLATITAGLAVTGGTTTDTLSIGGAAFPYSSGSWTPVLSFGGASVGITGTLTGHYTRIGNQTTVRCIVNLTSKGSSTGNALISGLPIAAASGSISVPPALITAFNMNALSAGFAWTIQAAAGGSTLTLASVSLTGISTGTAVATNSDFTNTSLLDFTYTYEN